MRGCSGVRKGADSGKLATSSTGTRPPIGRLHCQLSSGIIVVRVIWQWWNTSRCSRRAGLDGVVVCDVIWQQTHYGLRGFLRFMTVKTCKGCFPKKVFLCSISTSLCPVPSCLAHSRSSAFKKLSQEPALLSISLHSPTIFFKIINVS